MMRTIESLCKTLEKYLQNVPVRLNNIPASALLFKPLPEKWSKQEIFGHLIDSAVYNLERFTKIRFVEQPLVIVPYAQADLVEANNYQNADLGHLKRLWKSLNLQILNTWKNYSEKELAYKITIPYLQKEVDLLWWINDYVEHLEHHLIQIFGTLEIFELPDWQVTLEKAKVMLAKEQDKRFVTLLEHGSMYVEYYKPEGKDWQTPHRQDELYVVVSGKGTFYNNGKRHPFKAGDVLFAPAGIEHRFEDFSDDFATWVIFYGPDGGERHLLPFETGRTIEGASYVISTDDKKLDQTVIHNFLAQSYWAKGRSKITVGLSLANSLNFGLYKNGVQIGFARVISDFAVLAYLADVFVLEPHRGRGLGKWLIETIVKYERFKAIKKWILHTDDAHDLYRQFGFEITSTPERVMEKKRPNPA